ncbi:MAG TPA: hypothetical protein VM581_01540 [Magnetospirillaceae bacterium]|nr:hypothetical protein [Magnetospirillaceae bacterium]
MSDKFKIIGLAGSNGAGKDSVGAILADHHKYWFFPFTELFRAECRRRGIEVTRPHTRMISIAWREQSGLATLVDRSMQAFEDAGGFNAYNGIVMSSLRHPAEAERIHELGGTVIWIDADPRIRYDRIQAGASSRGRAGEDNKTFDQFLQEEQDEMHRAPGAGEATLNTAAIKPLADVTLINDAGFETLHAQLASSLRL